MVRRALEERWRQGDPTWVLSLDVAKAFDTVRHDALVECLLSFEVPHHLINRIITACLYEHTCIRWCGQTTEFRAKTSGVKQGCPISPRLFTLVLHRAVLSTLASLPRVMSLDNIRLPLILAYADDILLLASTSGEMGILLDALVPSLAETGLRINPRKSACLLWDPCDNLRMPPGTHSTSFSGHVFPIAPTLTYLGVSITSSLARVELTRPRVRKGVRAAHALIPFLRRHKLPWALVRRLYLLSVAPTILYGLKTTVLTKRNRTSLKRTERMLVRLLEGHSSSSAPSRGLAPPSTSRLLRGRTLVRSVAAMRLRYLGHVLRHPEGHLLRQAWELRPRRKKVGRPCLTWADSLREEVGRFFPGSVLEDIAPLLLDRGSAKELVETVFRHPDAEDSEEEEGAAAE